MKKIVFVSEIPTPYRLPVFEKLIERGRYDWTFVFLSETQKDRSWKLSLPGGPRYIYLKGIQWCIKGNYTFHFTFGLSRLLKSLNPDVKILGGYTQISLVRALMDTFASQKPYVMVTESHILKMRSWFKRALKKYFLEEVYGQAGANLVTSDGAKDYVVSYGAQAESCFLFPNSIDGPMYAHEVNCAREKSNELRKDLGIQNSHVVVLFVGALIERKGCHYLLQAFEKVASLHDHASLLLVGKGPLKTSAQALSQKLPGKVVFADFVQPEELVRYYALADIFVLPSLDEPFGAVVCEAMAAAMPIVVSQNVGASRNLVKNEENGFVIPSHSADILAETLAKLIQNADLRKSMGQRSLNMIQSWTYDFMAQQVERAVESAHSRIQK